MLHSICIRVSGRDWSVLTDIASFTHQPHSRRCFSFLGCFSFLSAVVVHKNKSTKFRALRLCHFSTRPAKYGFLQRNQCSLSAFQVLVSKMRSFEQQHLCFHALVHTVLQSLCVGGIIPIDVQIISLGRDIIDIIIVCDLQKYCHA